MLKLFLFSVVCVCIPFVYNFQGFLVGPGQWLVLNINTCDNPDQYEVEIELYQEVDGGFKYHQTLTNDCVCTYFKQNAKENMERAFTLANIYPPDCPIPCGAVKLRNFVMDYTELPKIGMYGTFEAIVYIVLNDKRIACVRVVLNFEIRNEDENNKNEVSTSSPVKRLRVPIR